MLKLLLTKKWIGLTIAVIILIPTFESLSDWQYRRLEARLAYNAAVINSEKSPVVPFVQLAPKGELLTETDVWRNVSAVGTFLPNEQYLVRKKSLDSEAGLWVVTPFVLTDGTKITVVRGWTAAGASAQESPQLSPVTTEQVELVGRLRQISPQNLAEPNDIPAGQRVGIDPKYGTAYLELISANPPLSNSEIRTLPAPTLTEGTHRSYAIQWQIFAVMLVGGYLILFRQDLIERRKLPVV